MKRWLVAVGLLLGGAASFSYADNYVLIRDVLGGRRDPNNPNAPAGGNPNQPMPPGGPRGPRGPSGPPGGGPPGAPNGPDGGVPNNLPSLGAGQTSDIATADLAV